MTDDIEAAYAEREVVAETIQRELLSGLSEYWTPTDETLMALHDLARQIMDDTEQSARAIS